MNILIIYTGACLGMLSRLYLSKVFIKLNSLHYFSATLLINAIACFIIGMNMTIINDNSLYPIFISSYLSALSTFSTFNYELITKFNNNKKNAIIYYVIALTISFISFYLGKYL